MGDLAALVGAGINVANDPYLGEVLCHLTQLEQIKKKQPVQTCQDTPDGIQGGAGLSRAVKPMRLYVFAEGHKWVYAAAAIGILAVPFWLGYSMGKD